MDIPIIETPMLRLRPPVVDDLADFIRLHADPRVMQFIGHGETWPADRSRRVLDTVIRYYDRSYVTRQMLDWLAVTDRATGEFEGICCLIWMPEINRAALGGGPYVEFGYRILPEH